MLKRENLRPFFQNNGGASGRRKSGGKVQLPAQIIIDESKYEAPIEYKATVEWSEDFVKDPNGTFVHAETHERYLRVEHLAENIGFKAIRSAPVGSVIVVHQPASSWTRGIGKIPEHNEYYEVREYKRSKSGKSLYLKHSTGAAKYRDVGRKRATIHKGYYISAWGASLMGGARDDWSMGTVKDIQKRFKYSDRITIYKPKNS